MRWFAWLVALCLLAAAVARPRPGLTLDRQDARVEDASERASLVPRRPTTFGTDKRADRRFDLEAAPAIAIVPPVDVARIAAAADHMPRAGAPRRLAQSSRGPPATPSAASHHT